MSISTQSAPPSDLPTALPPPPINACFLSLTTEAISQATSFYFLLFLYIICSGIAKWLLVLTGGPLKKTKVFAINIGHNIY